MAGLREGECGAHGRHPRWSLCKAAPTWGWSRGSEAEQVQWGGGREPARRGALPGQAQQGRGRRRGALWAAAGGIGSVVCLEKRSDLAGREGGSGDGTEICAFPGASDRAVAGLRALVWWA